MPLLRRVTPAQRDKLDPKGLAGLATRQHGVVDRGQLESLGISPSAISRWVAAGRLHRIHPGVYAVRHSALSLGGRLRAALLYVGSNAAFSHTTAAWLWRLIDAEPNRIHKTARGRRSSLPGVRLHHSPGLEIVDCRGLPVTGLARTLLDIAGMLSLRELRRALAEAEYRRLLRPAEVVNRKTGRMRVDAVWREHLVAVELDGAAGHGTWAQIRRDRQREMALRARGFHVVRYSWDQVSGRPDEVGADLRRLLAL
jgi:very-short-patch-repair endonuclease